MMKRRAERVSDDASMTIDPRSMVIPGKSMYFVLYRVLYMWDEQTTLSNYVDAFVNALSNRSRNLLNDANLSAMPDFPATSGRNSNNAASTPF